MIAAMVGEPHLAIAVPCDEAAADGSWPRRWASRRSWRACCASAGFGDPRRARASSIRRSSICTIRWRWPTWASPSIGILGAIARRERIAIHGDYDVDGITSTVILRRALELLGADVVHFIPERLKDGYGLQPAAIERLHADGVALIVSVDCGIRGAEAARRARELGVDLIITDHHEPDTELPPALAVINPKRRDCAYPDKNLAGVGVALKLVQALCHATGHDSWLPGLHQDRGHRHAGRRRAARRREPRHRQARTRPADARARTRSACARCSTSRA